MKAHRVAGLAAAFGLVAALLIPSAAVSSPASANANVIVVFAPGTDVAAEARALAAQGARVSFEYRNVFAGLAANVPAQALSGLSKNPRVLQVETDQVATLVGEQSTPTWGLDRIDQAQRPLDGRYLYPDASAAVNAYVVDTGVLASHSDLSGRVAPGYSAISDGRGSSDCNGHGTHVAGTTAGTVYGVAKTATVVPVRVLGCDGSGSYSGIIAGLDWIISHHAAGVPAVANLSLGGGLSSTLNTAVQRTIDDGVSVVVAAGNSNVDACTTSPASAPNAITVAASDSLDARASFSNWGSCIDLFAPGVAITSAWYTSNTATASLNGTSMSAPHVAGAAALLLGTNAALSPGQLTSTLLSQATTNVVTNAGTGTPNRLLRVAAAATEPTPTPAPVTATAPAAPTSVKAVAGKRSATVSWLQGGNGGSPLTAQTVYVFRGTTQVGTVSVGASATKATVSGLTASVSYTFKVSASNAIGTSPLSAASNAVTPKR